LNYYVYYEVDAAKLPAVRRAVEELFRKADAEFSIKGSWMRRRDDASTYMEIYEGVSDARAFEAFLEREGARVGVPRKLECFISAGTPA
jgi:hypothetical protein